MSDSFDKQLSMAMAQRSAAHKTLKRSLGDVTATVKKEAARVKDGTAVKELIEAHPYAAAGVAMGVGVIASRYLVRAAAPGHGSEPQRVVIEVKHSGAAVAPAAPAAPQHSSIVNFITQAMNGFQMAQNFLRPYLTPQTPPQPEPVERPAADSPYREPEMPDGMPTI